MERYKLAAEVHRTLKKQCLDVNKSVSFHGFHFPSFPFYFRKFWPDYFLHFPLKGIKPQEAEVAQHGYFIFSFTLKTKSLPLDTKEKEILQISNTFFTFFHLDRMMAVKAYFRASYLETKVPITERIYPNCLPETCRLKIAW